MSRKYNPEHKEYLKQHEICELCLRKAPLELHHIVPLSVGGYDTYRNWIAICPACHRKLTPTSILIDMAKQKSRDIDFFFNSFYEYIEEHLDDTISAPFDAIEMLHARCKEEKGFNISRKSGDDD